MRTRSVGSWGEAVNDYWFDVEVAGPVTDDDIEALGDVLTAGDGIDASVQADHRGGRVIFTREAEDAVQAVISAVRDVEAAGIRVTGVVEDRVVVSEIAERARVTDAAVRYWISGERGPGGFPVPMVQHERRSQYSWAEVAAWLARTKLGEADFTAAETAMACKIIDAALTVRDGLRELPRHARPLVRELVA
jgi:enamine deaminase RidA (YjgF/YER057c/UK114 family)